MALIDPTRSPAAVIPDPYEIGFGRYPDVQPFTQRAASGYQTQLEGIVKYITRELYPYLLEQAPQGIWDSNVDLLVDAVNAALTAQTADNVSKINTALDAIATGHLLVTDPSFLAVLNAANTQTRAWLDGHYAKKAGIVAPPPSGGDDTATIQALLNLAQSTAGTLELQAGVYKLNLATQQSFVQPKIIGAGKQYTKLQAYNKLKPVLIFQGGSGSESGGYLSDVQFLAHPDGGGIALALQDVCDVHWDRIRVEQGFDVGINFAVTQSQGFTEFCHGEATIQAGSKLAVQYTTVNSGETSFHGCGLDGGIINFSGPFAVQVDDHCFPYNAPMSATFFTHTANSQIIRNRYAGREITFWGTLRVEHQASGYVVLGAVGDGHGDIYYVGDFISLNGPVRLGRLFFLESLSLLGGNRYKRYKPFTVRLTGINGRVDIDPKLGQGGSALITVSITGDQFAYQATVLVSRSMFNAGGSFVKLYENLVNNGANRGSATFAVQDERLSITNNYAGYDITAHVEQIGNSISIDALVQ